MGQYTGAKREQATESQGKDQLDSFVRGNAKDEKLTALVIADEMGRGKRGRWLLSTLP